MRKSLPLIIALGVPMARLYALVKLGLCLVVLATLAGCASVPKPLYYEKSVSHAWPTPEDTRLGKYYAAAQARDPELSGMLLLDDGGDAFEARIVLTDAAERTLDIQSYLWYGDSTGKLVLSRLLAAAQRGVRVRLLIDDIDLNGLDFSLALLDSHPNLEVRIFNPFAARSSVIGRAFEFLGRGRHLNHRMHNKTYIADNVAAIVGGRNIGDHYFNVNTKANFRDLDVLAIGRVAREVSTSFDGYWNSAWAVPVKALVKDPPPEARVTRARDALQQFADQLDGYPYPYRRDLQATFARLGEFDGRYTWARATAFYDDPDKVGNPDARHMGSALTSTLESAASDLLIESAYFIPLDRGVATLADMTQRGVRIRVLTNSLASTDVMLAHVGYAKYRRRMLDHGVLLHEFRPDGSPSRSSGGPAFYGSSRVSLHSKAIVVDRRTVYIGTANLDPRSLVWNTEIGLLVESSEFASRVARFIETGMEPHNSWHVAYLGAREKALPPESKTLVWSSIRNGVHTRTTREPDVDLLRILGTAFLSLLPLDEQL
jgi:putative cardiolipin synthase